MLTSVVRVTTLSAPRLHASRWLSTAAKATQFKVEMLGGKDAGIALFTMDRPDARNALGRQFMAEFRQALDQVRFDPKVRVVILRSVVPKVFCAGADLKERLGMTQPEAAASSRGYRTGFTDLEQLPMPTIAAIEGAALGGGMEMALACDPVSLVPRRSLAFQRRLWLFFQELEAPNARRVLLVSLKPRSSSSRAVASTRRLLRKSDWSTMLCLKVKPTKRRWILHARSCPTARLVSAWPRRPL
ncbi:hypothetical protein PPTG_05320 [Phytophthora nicotianae INRA-310]|uniref:Uncharacterized protein n=1 Tax=Phytophthora nicotianae (strain INRA-310) TaxID=761204 RepID=W2QX66_PHYN3|nr:hypothetical protein PPTG_05320 [Phytophthora nicotianae INRA-310]ETN17536.1 hypothetical protein PPTG_05320 [Phytophthora nicotianae INRA-310]